MLRVWRGRHSIFGNRRTWRGRGGGPNNSRNLQLHNSSPWQLRVELLGVGIGLLLKQLPAIWGVQLAESGSDRETGLLCVAKNSCHRCSRLLFLLQQLLAVRGVQVAEASEGS